MEKFLQNKANLALLFSLVFISGWVGQIVYERNFSTNSTSEMMQVRENSPDYEFTNPLLYIDNSHSEFHELDPLKEEVESYINEQIANHKIDRASFYYRDLNVGAWTGVKPDDKYVPASLLKVAVLMSYLRSAEDDPSIVEQKLLYQDNHNERQNYPPSTKLEDGYYPLSKLFVQMIVESDNNASSALSSSNRKELNDLYASLRFPNPPSEVSDYMSTRDISRIFRSLYSSTYLLNSYSEQALKLLSMTKFDKGITQGVEPGIKVAHKFGEHTVYFTDPLRKPEYQLHDCGIVYFPKRPYFICVMTKGENLLDLEKTIGDIAAITSSFVKNL